MQSFDLLVYNLYFLHRIIIDVLYLAGSIQVNSMNRKLLLLVVFLFVGATLHAQVNRLPLKAKGEKEALKFISKSNKNHQLRISLNDLSWKSRRAATGDSYTELWFDNSNSTGEVGSPQLPAVKRLMLLPYGATATATVKNYTQKEFSLQGMGIKSPIFPVQPSVRKDQDSLAIPFQIKKAVYTKKEYIQNSIVSIEILGNMRSFTLARVVVTPVDYNPAVGTLKVFNDIDIEISVSSGTKTVTDLASVASPYFGIIGKSTLNSTSSVYDENPDLTKYPVKMLIVANRMFESSLAPFIEWKRQKGFNVVVAYTDVIGTSASQIKTYIQQQYNSATPEDPAPTFLVLVGDIAQLPASATGGQSAKYTDLYYASIDSDVLPEMYYGRLSATTTAQLDNIINKILYYEKYEFADPQYLNNVTLIAGADGTYNPAIAQPTIKYGTANYFNQTKGFSVVNEYGVSNDPNNANESSAYTGCYDPDKIAVGFINYTAHCSKTTWSEPELTISGINSFTNQNKYPFAVANCCESGDFGADECVGEAWIRAQNKGAVTYVGSSPYTYWYQDMYWSVGAFPMVNGNNGYVPSFAETTTGAYDASFVSDYRTVGAILFAGNLAVTQADINGYQQDKSPTYYWEAYNILGDPSLMPYFTAASENDVFYETTIPVGVNTIQVSALAGSYVSITRNSQILGTAYFAQTGQKDVPVQEIKEAGDYTITVTRPQTIPYVGIIEAVVATNAFLTLKSSSINDLESNNNGKIDFGETVKVNLLIKNLGLVTATNARVLIDTHDGFASLASSDSVFIGTIQSDKDNNTITLSDAFTFKVLSNVPNGTTEKYTLTFKSDQGVWTSTLVLVINAPVISVSNLEIDDAVLGNGNQMANPGETCYGVIPVINTGGSKISDLVVNISIPDTDRDYIVLSYEPFDDVQVEAGSRLDLKFRISVSPSVSLDKTVPVRMAISSPSNSYVQGSFDGSIDIVSGSTITMKNQSVKTCYAVFTDSGGDKANYSNNEQSVTTITSLSENGKLKVSFSEFSLESGYDYLYVYDGASTNSSQISGSPFSGANIPADIYASAQSLTFKFISDTDNTKPGWKATVICVEPTQVPLCVNNPSPANGSTSVLPSKLKWSASPDAQFYDVFIGYSSQGMALLSRVYDSELIVNVERGKQYFWKVIPGNYLGSCTNACETWSFQTPTTLGDVLMQTNTVDVDSVWFYDSGGATYNYTNNENYTLTFKPKIAGTKLKVAFEQFNVETDATCSYDNLKIYDGLRFGGILVGTYCGTNLPPTYTSTSTGGELTFSFNSDGGISRAGWKAKISTVASNPFYDLTISVSSDGQPLRGASVLLNNLMVIADDSGNAKFRVPAGNFIYSVNALGYEPVSGTGSNAGSNQTLNVQMAKLYSSSITTLDDATNQPISEAKISVDGAHYYTNKAGVAVIYTKKGSTVVTIDKLGYGTVTSNITVDTDGQNFSFRLKEALFAVDILVKDFSGRVLAQTLVETNGIEATTGADGVAKLTLPVGVYKFTATKDRYVPLEQWISVTSSNQVTFVLDTLYSELGDVHFTVLGHATTGIIPLEGANVDVLYGNSVYRRLSTNSKGEARLSLPDAAYSYVIEKPGFITSSPVVFNINNADYSFKDTLKAQAYELTFNVSSGGTGVDGAAITLSGYSPVLTNADGVAVIAGAQYAKGLTYIVQKEGYNEYSGNIDVDASKTVIVNLVPTDAPTVNAENSLIYPNPATDNIFVESTEPIKLVQVISVTGLIVIQQQANGVNRIELPVNLLARGTYIVRTMSQNGKIGHVKLIKL